MKIRSASIVVLFILIAGCAAIQPVEKSPKGYEGPRLIPGEGPVPGIPAEVEYADYWIRKTPNPDAVILSPEQIDEFNKKNPKNGDGIFDVLGMPKEIDGVSIRTSNAANARYLLDAELYIMENIPLEKAERARIVTLMDTARVPDIIRPALGMVLRRVQGKAWPTTVLFTRSPGDIEFDATVGSALDTGDPVALLHTSADGRWVYVQNEMYSCWLPADAVAFGSIETINEIRDMTNAVVAIGHRVTVYADPERNVALGSIQMGSHLPIRTAALEWLEVLFPTRGPNNELAVGHGFIRRSSDISIGYLPYTLRNVYQQAFVTFGRRYGWAGMYEERDCSGFVMDIFRCFGFRFPRTSGKQIQASPASLDLKPYDRATKISLLNTSPAGITIIGWAGHVMLYLGSVEGMPYVIQATWGMRENAAEGVDVTRRLARVLVADLMMDDGSERGPRIDRLTGMAIIGNYSFSSNQ